MRVLTLLMFMSLSLFLATSCTISLQNISTSDGSKETDSNVQEATAHVQAQIPASAL